MEDQRIEHKYTIWLANYLNKHTIDELLDKGGILDVQKREASKRCLRVRYGFVDAIDETDINFM